MKKIKLNLNGEHSRMVAFDSVELAEVEEDKLSVYKGSAAVFDKWSKDLGGFKEIIHSRAISAKTDFSDCLALFNHDEQLLLGSYGAGTLRVTNTGADLKVEIDEANTTISRNVKEWVRRKEVRGMSFRFRLAVESGSSELIYNESTRMYEHHVYDIAKILDISLVTRPAYGQTKVSLSRHLSMDESELNTLLETVKVKELPKEELEKQTLLVRRALERTK